MSRKEKEEIRWRFPVRSQKGAGLPGRAPGQIPCPKLSHNAAPNCGHTSPLRTRSPTPSPASVPLQMPLSFLNVVAVLPAKCRMVRRAGQLFPGPGCSCAHRPKTSHRSREDKARHHRIHLRARSTHFYIQNPGGYPPVSPNWVKRHKTDSERQFPAVQTQRETS